jgi:hypothetical protein
MHKPVFIIGSPRSGTTILLDLLSAHEDFAWVSHYSHFAPKVHNLAYLNRVYDIPFLGRRIFLKKNAIRNVLPHPTEPWGFWNAYLPKFQWERGGKTPPRRRTKEDISTQEIRNTRKAVQSICRFQHKSRFLSKYTDFPRIEYLTQVFPDAQFVHILRDGRAVINSYYNEVKKGNFKTWEEREWWLRGWPEAWCKLWKEEYDSVLSFLAFQWKFFLMEIWKDARCLPANQYLEIRYEELIENKKDSVQNIVRFCELAFSSRIKWYLERTPLYNMNYKWREHLNKEQQGELEEIIIEDEFTRTFEN